MPRLPTLLIFALLVLQAPQAVASSPIRPVPTPSLHELPETARQQIEAARRDVETARRGGGYGAAYGRLGARYLHAGLLEAALVALENATGVGGEGAFRWHYYLAVCEERRGNVAAAEDNLRQVLDRRAGNLPAVLRLADLLVARAESASDDADGAAKNAEDALVEARTLYQAALESPLGVAAAHAGLARLDEREGDLESASGHLRAALEAQPAATALHGRLARVLLAAGRGDAAEAEERLAGEVEVRSPDPLMQQLALEMGGVVEMGGMGSLGGTRSPLDAAEARPRAGVERSDDAGLLARLEAGERAAADGEPDAAARHFREVADAATSTELRARAHARLGLLHQASRRIEDAVAAYRQALLFDPNQRQALYNLGLILASNDRHVEAVETFEHLFDLEPENLDVRFRLAASLERLGRHWPALGHVEAILHERPDDLEALVSSALLLAEVGERGQGIERLETAASRLDPGPRQAEILEALGQMQRAAGETEKGLATLRRAVAAARGAQNAAPIRLSLARALAQVGLFEEADRHFAAYLETRPADESVHFARAMALILDDRDARAVAVLEGAPPLSSPHSSHSTLTAPSLTHLLARLLAGSPDDAVRDGARALELARPLFEAEPTPAHGETLALALAAAGRFEDAITLQKRLLAEARAADFDADYSARGERNLIRYQAGQPGVFGW